MKVKLTHRGGYRVFRDRVTEVECKTEREAIEAAVNLKTGQPNATVRISADYDIDVELEPED